MLAVLVARTSFGCTGPRTPEDILVAQVEPDSYQVTTRPSWAMAARAGAAVPQLAPPEQVAVQLTLWSLASVSDTTRQMQLDTTIRLVWRDERLRFNTTSDGGCLEDGRQVEYERHVIPKIWKPDLFLSEMDKKDDIELGGSITLWPDGTVKWAEKRMRSFSCDMDFSRMPFDDQYCNVTVRAYAGDINDVVFRTMQPAAIWEEGDEIRSGTIE